VILISIINLNLFSKFQSVNTFHFYIFSLWKKQYSEPVTRIPIAMGKKKVWDSIFNNSNFYESVYQYICLTIISKVLVWFMFFQ